MYKRQVKIPILRDFPSGTSTPLISISFSVKQLSYTYPPERNVMLHFEVPSVGMTKTESATVNSVRNDEASRKTLIWCIGVCVYGC